MNEKARPGVMLYFDKILPARERLSSESLGDLLNGILDYVLTGELPQLDDIAGMAFDIMRPGLDADGAKYAAECERNFARAKYAAYCKPYTAERKTPPLTFEEFKKKLLDANSNSETLNINLTQNQNLSLTQKVNLTQEQDLSINRQRGGEQEGELEDCKGEKEGGLLMPRYVPLSESEEQARRSAALKALQNYPT